MATVAANLLTAEAFWEWACRPENQERRCELDRGEIVDVPLPGELHGVICSFLAHLLWQYIISRGKGYVCGNDTGLIVRREPDTVRGPDLMAFDEPRRLAQLNRGFAEQLPKLVVGVVSPEDRPGRMSRRIDQYLHRGVPLVWVVDPEEQLVTVYRPDRAPQVVESAEEVGGGRSVAGSECAIAGAIHITRGGGSAEHAMIDLSKHIQQIHADLGWKRLSKGWAKVEILLGLFGSGVGLVFLLRAASTTAADIDWGMAGEGLGLFILGGYLALAGHRSHLYQSNIQLTAYLLGQWQQTEEARQGGNSHVP